MSVVFEESGFRFDFSKCLSVYKADLVMYHDLSALDFVVEIDDYVLFIEVKNPDNPRAIGASRKGFLADLCERLYPYVISDEYKNELLRAWAQGRVFHKPILCVFLLEFSMLSKTDRARLRERIFNRIPFSLNKAEFGGEKHFEKRFELCSVDEFRALFPMISVT